MPEVKEKLKRMILRKDSLGVVFDAYVKPMHSNMNSNSSTQSRPAELVETIQSKWTSRDVLSIPTALPPLVTS